MSEDENDERLHHAVSSIEKRLIGRSLEMFEADPKDVLYQHSVLCQTYFPYRDPKDARHWERSNGSVTLVVEAGRVIDPVTMKSSEVGLPFGPKSRLVFAHLNSRALKAGSNVIQLEEESFTQFVKSMQDPLKNKAVAPNGREIRAYKDQLTRFSVARFTLGVRVDENRVTQSTPQIIERMDVTWERDERQRILWPDTITLTPAYWQSLQKHAVPLDARALSALAHNALALDIYQWLAQRLHRIPSGQEIVLPRVLLHRQFGEGYARERKFWEVFTDSLRQVVTQYRTARVHVDADGLHMQQSLPPVPRRLFVVPIQLGQSQASNGGEQMP
jgi:hypothetical protein